jgi:hypothetical protein
MTGLRHCRSGPCRIAAPEHPKRPRCPQAELSLPASRAGGASASAAHMSAGAQAPALVGLARASSCGCVAALRHPGCASWR